MAEITSVRITHGSVRVTVDLIYRWYVPGNDPWTRTSGSSTSTPRSGDWENRAIAGRTTEVRMYSPSDGLVMKLINFTRVSVGSTGEGEFHASGYTIPQFSSIKWRVLSVT